MEIEAIWYQDGRIKFLDSVKLRKPSVKISLTIPDDAVEAKEKNRQGQTEKEVEVKNPELAEMLRGMKTLLGEGYVYVNDGRTDQERFSGELEVYYQ
jgi:hypothetical protein